MVIVNIFTNRTKNCLVYVRMSQRIKASVTSQFFFPSSFSLYSTSQKVWIIFWIFPSPTHQQLSFLQVCNYPKLHLISSKYLPSRSPQCICRPFRVTNHETMSAALTMFNHIKSTWFYLPSTFNHHVHKSWTEMALILITNDISRWDVLPSCVSCRTKVDPSALR